MSEIEKKPLPLVFPGGLRMAFMAGGALVLVLIVLGVAVRPYDRPEYVVIEPSQTAFLIPLEGKTSDQARFESESMVEQSKVASKRVQVPHRWIQLGRMPRDGQYAPTVKLIVLERKPVVREWTEADNTGTSRQNQGIVAETKESIGFMARMNCSAQIDEKSAARFLYRYYGKALEDVMDSDVRAQVEAKFTEKCANYSLDELLVSKDKVMDEIRKETMAFFAERGVTITVLGLKGEFSYLNPKIQEAIDNKFRSERDYQSQAFQNKKTVEMAEAKAREAALLSGNQVALQIRQLELRKEELDNQKTYIEKWNGVLPTYMLGSNPNLLMQMPSK